MKKFRQSILEIDHFDLSRNADRPTTLTSVVFRNRATGRIRHEIADPERMLEINEAVIVGHYELIMIDGRTI